MQAVHLSTCEKFPAGPAAVSRVLLPGWRLISLSRREAQLRERLRSTGSTLGQSQAQHSSLRAPRCRGEKPGCGLRVPAAPGVSSLLVLSGQRQKCAYADLVHEAPCSHGLHECKKPWLVPRPMESQPPTPSPAAFPRPTLPVIRRREVHLLIHAHPREPAQAHRSWEGLVPVPMSCSPLHTGCGSRRTRQHGPS